ncbi:MAG TPA: hypothetical protein VIL74_10160 [Pyrinomonadaceae bacterium]
MRFARSSVVVVGGPDDFGAVSAADGGGTSAGAAVSVSVVSKISSDAPFEPFSSGLLFLVTFGFVVFVAMSIFRLFVSWDTRDYYF